MAIGCAWHRPDDLAASFSSLEVGRAPTEHIYSLSSCAVSSASFTADQERLKISN
jgi:hypothetical protein